MYKHATIQVAAVKGLAIPLGPLSSLLCIRKAGGENKRETHSCCNLLNAARHSNAYKEELIHKKQKESLNMLLSCL